MDFHFISESTYVILVVGRISPHIDYPSLEQLNEMHLELEYGGSWRPSYCTARHRVAVIVPFMNRHEHLRIFLAHMHPFLQRQQMDYRIFVIEQV